jgi:hypothetical protein
MLAVWFDETFGVAAAYNQSEPSSKRAPVFGYIASTE